MLALPNFRWFEIYTTNFDRLIEDAYKRIKLDLVIIRSNYEYAKLESDNGTPLFKIHGCVTQDGSLGHKSNMILTEYDYEKYSKFREALFSRLALSINTKDVLIIGHSLKDEHLKKMIYEAAAIKAESGAPGIIYLLLYEPDPDRAGLVEDRGVRVAFGDMDQFVAALATKPSTAEPAEVVGPDVRLPLRLLPSTIEIAHAISLPSQLKKMFNGRPATYPDVQSKGTFSRTLKARISQRLLDDEVIVACIIGAAGVGKTTLARQIALSLFEQDVLVWEHKPEYSLRHSEWLAVEGKLREEGRAGLLFVDECTQFQRQINLLLDSLTKVDRPALRLLVTANSAQWTPRLKSQVIFARGSIHTLSQLDHIEMNSLVDLIHNNKEIAELIDRQFRTKKRVDQIEHLRSKCNADMFVCLKNIFANQNLDTILLQEYAELEDDFREIYRHVAALESFGAKVHRQQIVRLLNIGVGQIAATLANLDGIVDEYVVSEDHGIYAWATRHSVIARVISDYKFSSEEEIIDLMERTIKSFNPTINIELRSIRDICDREFGIGQLTDINVQNRLYRSLIEVAPSERVPWHRLIRNVLYFGDDFDEAERLIKKAEEAAGTDSPIDRYKVRLLLARAEKTEGILEEDRLAMLRRAERQARQNIQRHRVDKYSYFVACEVALQMVRAGESHDHLDSAIQELKDSETNILDPEIGDKISFFERERSKIL